MAGAFVDRDRWARIFPRGPRDFGLQLSIWLGFLLLYQVARGVADRGAEEAFANGRLLIDWERSITGLFEVDIQRVVIGAGDGLVQVLNWTYWNSQFTVIGLALLWVYFARNESFLRFRNLLLLANVLGLIGFMAMPTAPPRLFPGEGFVDTLATASGMNHGSGLIQLASNQFAAMPSLHAADALIVAIVLIPLVRSRLAKLIWALWPAWVWFTVMATGNHFWLDVAAGVALAGATLAIMAYVERRLAQRSEAYGRAAVS
ncbi:MAG: phosphatase PAP2 family protein [Gaiellaceae bacterium]